MRIKYILLHFVITIAPFVAMNAQSGIAFKQSSWQEVLAAAKAEKKPIFIDVYTSWCGPCKQMVKEVFVQKEVADKFNNAFINFKIDAEKGEGVTIAQKFKVNAYPTYLFVNENGELIYRSLGSMPTERFMNEATIALNEYKDPKPLALWEDEYNEQKNNAEFLFSYLKKRKKQRLNCADLLDQIQIVAGKDAVLQSDVLQDLGLFLQMNTDGPFYNFLKDNKELVVKTIDEKTKKKFFIDLFLIQVAKTDIERAILKNDDQLLEHIVKTLLSLPPDEFPTEWREYEVRMKYYTQVKEKAKLIAVMKKYAPAVLGYDVSKIKAKDSLVLVQFDKDVESGKLKFSSPQALQNSRQARGVTSITSFAYRIREMSKSFFQIISDMKDLENALEWINKGMTYSNNFTMYEAKAGILYKLGKKDAAIEVQQEGMHELNTMLARLSLTNDKASARMQSNLEKMQRGEPTWTVMAEDVSGKTSTKSKK